MPLVTIYLTNYNYEQYCKQAIDSILEQSFTDFELIIIDDGSCDNSCEIINLYSSVSNVEIIYQKNIGLNRTNNKAFSLALGKYVVRVDADDWLAPTMIEELVNVMEGNPGLALVFPDYYEVDEKGRVLHQIKRHDFKSDVVMLDQPAHGACTMIRREIFEEVGGYNEAFSCQDGYDIWLSVTTSFEVRNIAKPLFYYRQHSKSLTRNNRKILETRKEIYKSHVVQRELDSLNVVGVIPIRGNAEDGCSLALRELGEHRLVDWTINSALKSETLSHVVLTTSDSEIVDYIRDKYKGSVEVIRRPEEFETQNQGLANTLAYVVDKCQGIKVVPDALMVLSIESPFCNELYIDTAVYSMQLYSSDVVDSVIMDDSIFYFHNGQGLTPWKIDQDIRLERDVNYKRCGGINLVRHTFLKETMLTIGGRMGHVVIDEKSAMSLRSEFDWDLLTMVAKKQ